MVPPFVDENHRMFHLQVSGEALWNWRDVCRPGTLSELLQASILPLRYQLHDSACERVGDVVARSVRRFREKVQSSTNGKKRKRLMAETWVKLGIKPEEIKQTPSDGAAKQSKRQPPRYRGKVGGIVCRDARKACSLWKRFYRSRKKAAAQTFNTNTVS